MAFRKRILPQGSAFVRRVSGPLGTVKAGVPKILGTLLKLAGGPFWEHPDSVISVVVASKGGWLWRHSISPRWSGPVLVSPNFQAYLPTRSSARKQPIRPTTYRIVMAVAGFGSMELVQEQNRLTIRGKRRGSDGKTYLHRGIATRACVHHFDLADYVEVTDAAMGEGLLVISLRRELPEAAEAARHSYQRRHRCAPRAQAVRRRRASV